MKINNGKNQFDFDSLKIGVKKEQFSGSKMQQIFNTIDGVVDSNNRDGVIDADELAAFKMLLDI